MEVREKLRLQIEEIKKSLYGIDEVIKTFVLSKAADLTVLLIGAHALAKSSLARDWSTTTGLDYRVVTSCFDGETEVLTKAGWKGISEATLEDEIATLNLESGVLEYQRPLRLFKYYYDGEMYRVKHKWLDLLVTPNHKMVVSRYASSKGEELVLKEVKEMFGRTEKFKKDAIWEGKKEDFFYLPKTKYLNESKHGIERERVPLKPFLKFLGYWLAGGSIDLSWNKYSKGFGYRICLSMKDPELLKEFTQAVEEMGYNVTEYRNGRYILNKQLLDYLKQFGHAKEKSIPQEVKGLDRGSLETFLEAYLRGDGSKRKGRWPSASTTSKRLADDLQEIALKIGKSASIKMEKPGKVSVISGREIITKDERYTLIFTNSSLRPKPRGERRRDRSRILLEGWIPFKGFVYCLETPNHTLYVRRNGIPIWSGNSEVDEALIAYIDPAVFREKNVVQMRPGELMLRDHILIDEFFLWSNKYRAKLHQLLEERTYAGCKVETKSYTFSTNPLSEFYPGQVEERNLACYSEDTEILTLEGWKSYRYLKEKEWVFTLNPLTGEIEVECIQGRYVYNYEGKMYLLKGQQFDFLVTPNHRMWVATRKDLRWNWGLREAREIFGRRFKIAKTGIWKGREKDIPDQFLELFGYYLAAGTLKADRASGHYGIELGLYKPGILEKIPRIAKKLGYNPHTQKDGSLVIWNKRLWKFFRLLGRSPSRFIPDFLKDLPPEKLKLILFSYLEGNGWRDGEYWAGTTDSTLLRDDLQEISLKCGYAMNYSPVKICGGTSFIQGRRIKSNYPTWLLSLIRGGVTPTIPGKGDRGRRVTEEWVDYKGPVWCVQTKNGILYVRRDGKPAWSGNTLDRIDLALPVFQPKIAATQEMIKKFSKRGRQEMELKGVVSWSDYLKAREEILKIEIPSDLLVWLSLFAESMSSCKHSKSKFDVSRARMHLLCSECNQKEHLCSKVALSKPRFLRATILLSKALAWFDYRDKINIEDIYEAIKYTLPHRFEFLREEKTIFEASEILPELLQQFIDDFNNWEARGIFERALRIREQAKDPVRPFFDREASNLLLNEVSEHLAISNYMTEAVEKIEGSVKDRYREILGSKSGLTVEEMKEILSASGLSPYDKGEILDEIMKGNLSLTFYRKLDRKDPRSLKQIARALAVLHKEAGQMKIKPEKSLLRKFKDEVSFTSDLLTIKERDGEVRVTATTPELRKRFEDLLEVRKVGKRKVPSP